MTLAWLCAVFPAHAGMSPARADLSPLRCCFPRTRGDEPEYAESGYFSYRFSPHTRG